MKIRIIAECTIEFPLGPGDTETELLEYYSALGDGLEALCSASNVTLAVSKVGE